jgi:hypothetical protein
MDYRLWHQGAANRSNRPRPVLYIIYTRSWFTDLVNFRKHARLRLSKEDALAMPRHSGACSAESRRKGVLI